MLKRLWVRVVFLLALVVTLLALLAPARLILIFTQHQPIQFANTSGKIWKGSATVSVEETELGQIYWTMSPFSLLLGEIDIEGVIKGPQVDLFVQSSLDRTGQQHQIDGLVSLELLNPRLIEYEIQLSGDVALTGVNVIWDGESIQHLQGNLHWDGGVTKFRLLRILNELQLPALTGELDAESTHAVLTALDKRSNKQVIKAELEPKTGWLHLTIYPAFLEYVGAPPIPTLSDSTFLFQVSEKIY